VGGWGFQNEGGREGGGFLSRHPRAVKVKKEVPCWMRCLRPSCSFINVNCTVHSGALAGRSRPCRGAAASSSSSAICSSSSSSSAPPSRPPRIRALAPPWPPPYPPPPLQAAIQRSHHRPHPRPHLRLTPITPLTRLGPTALLHLPHAGPGRSLGQLGSGVTIQLNRILPPRNIQV